MNILGIQILGVLFGLFMFYLTFLHRQRKEFTVKEYAFWAVVWVGFLAFSFFPRSLDFFIEDVLNFSRRIDFFIITGFMFLLGIVFYLYTVLRQTQRKIEKIIRKTAIKEAHKPTNKETSQGEKNENPDSL